MNDSRPFTASCVALSVTAMSFALRGAAADSWTTEFAWSHERVGWINSKALWCFTLALVLGGAMGDALGMKHTVWLASSGHAAGIDLTILA